MFIFLISHLFSTFSPTENLSCGHTSKITIPLVTSCLCEQLVPLLTAHQRAFNFRHSVTTLRWETFTDCLLLNCALYTLYFTDSDAYFVQGCRFEPQLLQTAGRCLEAVTDLSLQLSMQQMLHVGCGRIRRGADGLSWNCCNPMHCQEVCFIWHGRPTPFV